MYLNTVLETIKHERGHILNDQNISKITIKGFHLLVINKFFEVMEVIFVFVALDVVDNSAGILDDVKVLIVDVT